METARSGDALLLRLDHGEDVLRSIGDAVSEERSTMMVVAGLGMLSEFEIGYFDRGRYITKEFGEAHELLAMQGSVSTAGEPRIHIHVTVADKAHTAFGGHLLAGKVWMSNEILLKRVEGVSSERRHDPDKKVGVLRLNK
jgi:predicted DNA-binding protein with PD1-like motif